MMFLNTLSELEGGYVTTFAYDCQWKGAKNMDYEAFKKHWGCEKSPYQPAFVLYKTPDIRVNPYTGKRMPLEIVGIRT